MSLVASLWHFLSISKSKGSRSVWMSRVLVVVVYKAPVMCIVACLCIHANLAMKPVFPLMPLEGSGMKMSTL